MPQIIRICHRYQVYYEWLKPKLITKATPPENQRDGKNNTLASSSSYKHELCYYINKTNPRQCVLNNRSVHVWLRACVCVCFCQAAVMNHATYQRDYDSQPAAATVCYCVV